GPEPEGGGAEGDQREDLGRDRRAAGEGRRDLADADGPAVRVRAAGLGRSIEGLETNPHLCPDGRQDEGHRRRRLPPPGRERRGDSKRHPRILREGLQRRQRGPPRLLGRAASLPSARGRSRRATTSPSGLRPRRSPWATFPLLSLQSEFRLVWFFLGVAIELTQIEVALAALLRCLSHRTKNGSARA